jgi:hypothetical protein
MNLSKTTSLKGIDSGIDLGISRLILHGYFHDIFVSTSIRLSCTLLRVVCYAVLHCRNRGGTTSVICMIVIFSRALGEDCERDPSTKRSAGKHRESLRYRGVLTSLHPVHVLRSLTKTSSYLRNLGKKRARFLYGLLSFILVTTPFLHQSRMI